ncbi:MAG: LysE family translocator [Bacteroidota bacterium]
MHPLLLGIQAGIFLAILVGPLLVALIQASLEQGTRAGLAVGLGIWFSDLVCILAVYFGVQQVQQLTEWDGFYQSVGGVGAGILLVTGIATLLTPPPDLDQKDHLLKHTKGSWALFTKGFLINTVNPFTIVFWVTVMMTIVVEKGYSASAATLFFGGILGTIVTTDSLKIVLAKKIRHRLTARHLWWVRRVAGATLVIFGVVLLLRVLW